MTITIELPDHLLEYIQTQITAGPYTTIGEYIQALIEQDMAKNSLTPKLN
jgi:Arc/MetJ-type ribon-helix-helix transcriptional regulator